MNKLFESYCTLILFVICFNILPVNAQEQVEIVSGKDNTLFESSDGSLSNGAGNHLFVGRTAQESDYIRRALIWFDIASEVPAGAEITSVALTMNVSMVPNSTLRNITLHRVTADWGEGNSQAGLGEGVGGPAEEGDATWIHRFYDSQQWDNPGGDYSAEISGAANVGGNGLYTWQSTQEMIHDIQHWLDNPEENFGWILLGNEEVTRTAKRFDSRHHPNENNRPRLTIEYTLPTSISEKNPGFPSEFKLLQNYPNPFNPVTTIGFMIPEASHVEMRVFDITGKVVAVLVDEVLLAGVYRIDFDAGNLSSGAYFYGIRTTAFNETKLMILVR